MMIFNSYMLNYQRIYESLSLSCQHIQQHHVISTAPLCLRHGSNGSPAAAAEVSQTKRSPDAYRPGRPGSRNLRMKIRVTPKRLILVGK